MKRIYLGIGLLLGAGLIALTGYAMQEKESKVIGEEKAEEIALEDAGADRQTARMEGTTLEYDDGQYVYDVEFSFGGLEYDYDIRARDGEILSSTGREKEQDLRQGTNYEEALMAAEEEDDPLDKEDDLLDGEDDLLDEEDDFPEQEDTAGEETPSEQKQSAYIGIEEARAIALADAGYSEEEVVMEKARFEKDDDDDPPAYEIEFTAEGREYEYVIHAESGAVLEKEADEDDD